MNKKDFSKSLIQYFIESTLALIKIIFTIIPKSIVKLSKMINKRLKFSITFKTTTIYTLIFSSIFFIFSTVIIGLFSFYLYNEAKNDLDEATSFIEYYLFDDNSISEDTLNKYLEVEKIKVSIFNSQKDLTYSTNKDYDISLLDEFDTPSFKQLDGEVYLYINKKTLSNEKSYYVQLSKKTLVNNDYILILLAVLGVTYLIAIIITISKGSRTIKKMLRPIYQMTSTANSISAKALNTRLDVVDSHDELKELAETFNSMLDRIESFYEQQNRFVSDASHELRTPISVIQGYVNLLSRWGKEDKAVLDESITAIKKEAASMKDLVENLLFLARADKNTQSMEKEHFYINELIDEIVKDTRLIADNHNIVNTRNDLLYFYADRNLIKQCIRIFIDNSIKYTPANGDITINSSLYQNKLKISIEDTGIGISKDDLPRIFDRFYRCDKARSRQSGGTGLGLSISKWIIGIHNGTIDVESALNKGTKIIITFSTI